MCKCVLAFCDADCAYIYMCGLSVLPYWEQLLSVTSGWTWGHGPVSDYQVWPYASNKEGVSGYS